MLWFRRMGVAMAVFVVYGCQVPDNPQKKLQSIFSGDSISTQFRKAEGLLGQRNFLEAKKEFHSLSLLQGASAEAIEYARENEMLSAYLTLEPAGCVPLPASHSAPVKIVHGLNVFLCDPGNTIDTLREMIRVMENGKLTQSVHYLIALEKLAWYNYTYVSRIDTAMADCKRALSLAESFDELNGHQSFLLYSLAELSIMVRDVRAGLNYVQRGLQVNTVPEMEGYLVGLKATMYRRLRSYDSADFFYGEARNIFLKQNDPAGLSEVLRERALMAIILNQDTGFSKVMSELSSIDSLKRSHRVNEDRLYGYFYFTNKKYPQSIEHYEKALTVLEAQYFPDIVQIGEAYYALIESNRALNQFEKAEYYSFKSLVMSTPNRGLKFTWDNLVSSRLYSSWPNSFVMYGLLADTYLDHYKADPKLDILKKSFTLYDLTDRIMERQLRANEEEAWLNYASAVGERIYSGGIATCFELYSKTMDTLYLHQAHRFMERSKAMIVYRDILMRHTDYFPDVPASFRERDLELKSRIEYLKGTGSLSSVELAQLLEEQRRQTEELQSKFPSFYSSLFELAIPPFAKCAVVGEKANVSVIQYQVTKDYIYMIKYDAPSVFHRIPRDSLFDQKLNDFRSSLARPPGARSTGHQEALRRNSYDLYKLLVYPLGKLKNSMLLVTDGILSQIPFEALVSGTADNFRTGRYLIQDKQIDYSYSLKVSMMMPAQKAPKIDRVLGYSYSSPGDKTDVDGGVLTGLRGAAAELASIQEDFHDKDLVFRYGEEATKESFLEDVHQSYDLIHVAMHASSSPVNRWDNKIFFQKGQSLDTLYASEIISKKINASLVVLTGCSTFSGAWVKGEGTYTLARAFHRAGAKKVVASLWPLPDQSSATITESFYTHLVQGKSVAESLWLAKIEFIKAADTNLAHPYFWAGLICL